MDRPSTAPLTADEERRLALLVREGDRGARNRLVEANVALVAHLARRMRPASSHVSHADLVQEGVLGLMQAVERFDPDRGHRFSTYATWWIRGSILRALRAAPSQVSLTAHDGLVEQLPADGDDPVEDAARGADAAGLEELLDALPARSRRVVALRYGLEGRPAQSVAEVARSMGTSQARVRRIEEHALARLRALPATKALLAA
jgi:RNA polymerase sigma factor (sigma-70 family)